MRERRDGEKEMRHLQWSFPHVIQEISRSCGAARDAGPSGRSSHIQGTLEKARLQSDNAKLVVPHGRGKT